MAITLSKLGNSPNAMGMVDDRVPNRWLDAWGNVDKALVETYRAADWTVTATNTSPVTASLLADAKILITTQNIEYAGDNMQLLGTMVKLDAGKPVYFRADLTVSNATQSDLLVGLCGTDTHLIAASGSHILNVEASGVFFSKLDEVTSGFFKTVVVAAETNSAAAFTLDTARHIYEIFWDGAKLIGSVDGVEIGSFTTNIPTAVLTPSICFRAGTTTAVTCTVHEFKTIAVRG